MDYRNSRIQKFFILCADKDGGWVRKMNSQQVQNKPTAAYSLAMIGGIIGLIVGIFLLIVIIGIWIIISSVIVIISAQKLNDEPMEHTKWGTIIIIFSIIGIGSLLALIGGILALVYKPELLLGHPLQRGPKHKQ